MPLFEEVLVPSSATILEVLGAIDRTALEIAMVVDEKRRLLGTVTDGDIRRALLRGTSLDRPAADIMNRSPITASLDQPEDELLFLMSRRSIKALPVTDGNRRVVGLRLLKELVGRSRRDTWAVIMAGGLGQRLGALTAETPKPLLPVGSRPLLGTILSSLRQHGIWNIFIAVKYRAEMIMDYLGDGSRFDVRITWLQEREFLGTAGALSLLPSRPTGPFLVMNGDLLTRVNFVNLLEYHQAAGKGMTVCIREFRFRIPYGVVETRGNELLSIVEKPEQEFFINSGIYVLEPDLLDRVPAGTRFDMPSLIEAVRAGDRGVACFPLAEFWMDIGQPEEYHRAQSEFADRFEPTGGGS